jgi:hypothetical protein
MQKSKTNTITTLTYLKIVSDVMGDFSSCLVYGLSCEFVDMAVFDMFIVIKIINLIKLADKIFKCL